MVANLNELREAISDWIDRPEIEPRLGTFIRLAEADMDRAVRHYRMERRSTATAAAGVRYVALPADWIEAVRLSITVAGVTRRLDLATDPAMLDARHRDTETSGVPTHYLITTGELELYPTPDQEYQIEMVYRGRVPALTDLAPTNWLLEEAPDAYLYGALTRVADFVGDARAATWGPLYAAAIENLNRSSDAARYSGSGLRLARRGLA